MDEISINFLSSIIKKSYIMDKLINFFIKYSESIFVKIYNIEMNFTDNNYVSRLFLHIQAIFVDR